jgi:hypothetical protein
MQRFAHGLIISRRLFLASLSIADQAQIIVRVFSGGQMAAPAPFGKGRRLAAGSLCALAFERFQKLKDFAHHRFRLALNFFNQNFLRAHVCKLNGNCRLGKMKNRRAFAGGQALDWLNDFCGRQN